MKKSKLNLKKKQTNNTMSIVKFLNTEDFYIHIRTKKGILRSQTGEGLQKREYFKSIKRTKKEHYKENKFTFYKDENV